METITSARHSVSKNELGIGYLDSNPVTTIGIVNETQVYKDFELRLDNNRESGIEKKMLPLLFPFPSRQKLDEQTIASLKQNPISF